MRSRRTRWLSAFGAVVLIGTLVMVNSGTGVSQAGAQAAPNPLTVIIDKLNQILAALTSAAGQNNHTQRWDTNNPTATRFTTAFTGAVLDKNTGLVWEQAPDAAPFPWLVATVYCVNKEVPAVGGTRGWRLPSVVELASVQDPSLPAPFVPASVFSGVQSALYWSATTDAGDPNNAWEVNFLNGGVGDSGKAFLSHPVWCVRGGMNADAY